MTLNLTTITCTFGYVWDYFGQPFMFGAISDIKKKQQIKQLICSL